jgi:hypothetical protein
MRPVSFDRRDLAELAAETVAKRQTVTHCKQQPRLVPRYDSPYRFRKLEDIVRHCAGHEAVDSMTLDIDPEKRALGSDPSGAFRQRGAAIEHEFGAEFVNHFVSLRVKSRVHRSTSSALDEIAVLVSRFAHLALLLAFTISRRSRTGRRERLRACSALAGCVTSF